MIDKPRFVGALDEWQAREGLTQRQLALLIGCHETLLSHFRSGQKQPTPEFMTRAIARAPEPWKSSLKVARQADQDAADARAASLAVA